MREVAELSVEEALAQLELLNLQSQGAAKRARIKIEITTDDNNADPQPPQQHQQQQQERYSQQQQQNSTVRTPRQSRQEEERSNAQSQYVDRGAWLRLRPVSAAATTPEPQKPVEQSADAGRRRIPSPGGGGGAPMYIAEGEDQRPRWRLSQRVPKDAFGSLKPKLVADADEELVKHLRSPDRMNDTMSSAGQAAHPVPEESTRQGSPGRTGIHERALELAGGPSRRQMPSRQLVSPATPVYRYDPVNLTLTISNADASSRAQDSAQHREPKRAYRSLDEYYAAAGRRPPPQGSGVVTTGATYYPPQPDSPPRTWSFEAPAPSTSVEYSGRNQPQQTPTTPRQALLRARQEQQWSANTTETNNSRHISPTRSRVTLEERIAEQQQQYHHRQQAPPMGFTRLIPDDESAPASPERHSSPPRGVEPSVPMPSSISDIRPASSPDQRLVSPPRRGRPANTSAAVGTPEEAMPIAASEAPTPTPRRAARPQQRTMQSDTSSRIVNKSKSPATQRRWSQATRFDPMEGTSISNPLTPKRRSHRYDHVTSKVQRVPAVAASPQRASRVNPFFFANHQTPVVQMAGAREQPRGKNGISWVV